MNWKLPSAWIGKSRVQCSACSIVKEIHAIPTITAIQLKNAGWSQLDTEHPLCQNCTTTKNVQEAGEKGFETK